MVCAPFAVGSGVEVIVVCERSELGGVAGKRCGRERGCKFLARWMELDSSWRSRALVLHLLSP